MLATMHLTLLMPCPCDLQTFTWLASVCAVSRVSPNFHANKCTLTLPPFAANESDPSAGEADEKQFDDSICRV